MKIALGARLTISVAGISLFLLGCGPIEYISQVTRKATTAVEGAKAVDAATYSPYWYTLAVEYLRQARNEAAYSDFQAANRFGRRAEEAARRARELAIQRAADPEYQKPSSQPADAPSETPSGLAPLVPEGSEAKDPGPDPSGTESNDSGPEQQNLDDESPPRSTPR